MKKIIITTLVIVAAHLGYSQTYKKQVIGSDTLLVITETKASVDTLNRKQIKEQIEKFKADKQARLESIKQLQLNIDYYNAKIDRLKLLLKKTD